jgi:mRNA interferase RelE/StbE
MLYRKSVQRDLKKLTKREARRILDQLESALSKKSDAYPILKGEFAGLRKFRVGDYRIIYSLIDENIAVLRIGYRREVYQ